ncbi:PLP-dependent transferase, partial [Choiromyces venosus 120613-1]
LHRRFISSNFMNKTGVKLAEVSVGNGLMVDVMMSPSTGIFNQTTIMDEGSRTIYFNMQATNPTDPCALDAILPIYAGLYGNPHSHTHPYGWETKKVIDIALEYVAKLSGAYPKGIIFTWGATGSNDMSIKYVARLCKSKKHIIALQTEHKCVLDLCRHLQEEGYGVTYLPVENNDLINLEHLEKAIRPNTALVSIMMVNNEIEVIQQMEEMRKLGQKQSVFFLTNSAQAQGKISIDAGKWNVDWMSISGPKVYGSKRIAACYIPCRLKVRIDPHISDGGQEDCLRSGTLAHSLVIGFGEAGRIAQEEIEVLPSSPTSPTCKWLKLV